MNMTSEFLMQILKKLDLQCVTARQFHRWHEVQTLTKQFLPRAIFLLAVVAAANTLAAQIQFKQASHAGGGDGASQAVTLNGTTRGDLLVVGSTWCDDAACSTVGDSVISSVTDSTGDTCAQVPNAAQHNAAGTRLYEDIWYCQNIRGGKETVTVSYTGTVYSHYVFLSEFSGVSRTSPVDLGFGYNFNPQDSNHDDPQYPLSNFYIATPGNTSQTGDLIYSLINPDANSGTITPGNKALSSLGNDEYQMVNAVGPYMNTWTTSSKAGTSVVMGLAAFKSASGSRGTISNTVTAGAAIASGDQGVKNFEEWLGVGDYNGYAIEYTYYAFLCSGSDTNCINNQNQVTDSFPANRSKKLVISVALTGCDYTANLSGTLLCTAGHTIPLTGPNSVASGYEDAVFNNIFSAIKSKYGAGPIIRPGWEMNMPGKLWTWAVGGSGGSTITNRAYAAAFQHVAAIAHGYGFKVDWCPNWGPSGRGAGPADAFYPGDASVDEIGMDIYDYAGHGYNYYAGNAGAAVSPVYGFYWLAAFAALHHKPMAFDEWGVGGNQSTDANGADIINGLAGFMASEAVNYLITWQVVKDTSKRTHSYPYCGHDTSGICGSPYGAPLSEAAFCTQFAQTGYTCTK